jgi:hypothetical protein
MFFMDFFEIFMDDSLYKKVKIFLANFSYFFSHINEKNNELFISV